MNNKTGEPINYWNYLKLDQLLNLQTGLEKNDDQMSEDEMHFIVVHQVFELWFKLMIRELDLVRDKMSDPKVEEEVIPFAVHHLKRVNIILGLAVKHFDLMETLPPQDFLVFRSKLGTASGFQSFQMRELELLLGLELSERKAYGHGNPIGVILKTAETSAAGKGVIEGIEKAKEGPSLRDVIHGWLYRTPIQGVGPGNTDDESVVDAFLNNYLAAMKRQQEQQIQQLASKGNSQEETVVRKRFETMNAQSEQFLFARDVEEKDRKRLKRIRAGGLFIESYRELPLLSWPRLLLDTVVELEELFITFRFRHARMVERMIGRRIGTGGSSGVDYLDKTTKYRIFKELWAVRTLLLPQEWLPKLEKPEKYGFLIEYPGK
ncbi:MAG: tryptophan 2,3-dioxygenase family protein [Candidatus Aminicenantes bacterium]|jgi:tryptophan 2,3-dioxygenase